jgi:hypothetical protein
MLIYHTATTFLVSKEIVNSSEKVLICIYPMVEDEDYNINFFLLKYITSEAASASFRG